LADRRPDRFYEDIEKERRRELAEKVTQKKRLYIHAEMMKKDLE
jgi:hypothetical protein